MGNRVCLRMILTLDANFIQFTVFFIDLKENLKKDKKQEKRKWSKKLALSGFQWNEQHKTC